MYQLSVYKYNRYGLFETYLRRYRLATRTIYDIIKRQRAKAVSSGQIRLPGV